MNKNPSIMQKNQPAKQAAAGPYHRHINDSDTAPKLAQTMRQALKRCYDGVRQNEWRLRIPSTADVQSAVGDGHFHLATEVFLQISGWTRFQLPNEVLLLQAGEVLLMPAKLLHAEVVGADAAGDAFSNLVIYVEDTVLTCHLATEVTPGTPRAIYLAACEHVQGQRIQYWLNDAVEIANAQRSREVSADEIEAQIRALVLAAITGVMHSLDERQGTYAQEPQSVAMARLLIQNQLGDHQFSVRGLAAQLGCTADHLSRLFHQSTGEHLVSYVNRLRMARAARLLRESTLSAKEVAWSCGFVTQSYFIRVFRQQFNMTPKAWRDWQL